MVEVTNPKTGKTTEFGGKELNVTADGIRKVIIGCGIGKFVAGVTQIAAARAVYKSSIPRTLKAVAVSAALGYGFNNLKGSIDCGIIAKDFDFADVIEPEDGEASEES